MLDRGAREADALGNEPALQAELRHTLGTLYLKLGHPDRAEPLLISALSAWRSLFGERDARTIRTQQALAQLRIEQSRFGEAEKLARGALASAQNRFASTSREVAAARAVLGKVYGSTGAYDKAIEMLQPAVAVLSTLRPGVELSEALGDLANANYSLGRISESEALNRQALPIEQQVFGDRHPHVAVTLSNLGNIRLDYGDYAEGERLFRQALELNESWYGPNHPKAANSALMLGRAVAYRGRSDEAQALYARALSGFEAAYGTGHIRTAGVLSLMGDLARESGRLDDAERSFERAAAIFKSIVGDKHESYVHQLSNLGSVYYRQKRFAEGERVLRTAVDYLRERLPAHRYTALAEMRLAQTLGVRGDLAEAEQHALAAYRALQQALPGSSAIELQQARRTLRSVYERRGKLDLARALDSESSAETGPSGEP